MWLFYLFRANESFNWKYEWKTDNMMMIKRAATPIVTWPSEHLTDFFHFIRQILLNKQKMTFMSQHVHFYVTRFVKFWLWASSRFWQRQSLANELDKDRHNEQVLDFSFSFEHVLNLINVIWSYSNSVRWPLGHVTTMSPPTQPPSDQSII